MKLLFALTLCASFAVAAERPAAKPPKPLEVPAAAVESEPGAFHYTDAQGAKWIYYKTPFGVARVADRPVAPKPAPQAENIKAVDAGDVVRFERPGPFGTYRWERRKSEMTEAERAAWTRQNPAAQE